MTAPSCSWSSVICLTEPPPIDRPVDCLYRARPTRLVTFSRSSLSVRSGQWPLRLPDIRSTLCAHVTHVLIRWNFALRWFGPHVFVKRKQLLLDNRRFYRPAVFSIVWRKVCQCVNECLEKHKSTAPSRHGATSVAYLCEWNALFEVKVSSHHWWVYHTVHNSRTNKSHALITCC